MNNINWANYVYAITIVVVIYYTSVAIIYYRNDLHSLLRKISKRFDPASTFPIIPHQNNVVIAKDDLNGKADEHPSIGLLLASLQAVIKKAGERHFPKEELLVSLQL